MASHKKRFRSAEIPILLSLFERAQLKFVDIGGRGKAFEGIVPLAPFARYYVSEPDREEAERLREGLPRDAPWQGVTIINEAIASRPGPVDLYMTASPGMSSLLEPDPAVVGRYCAAAKFAVESAATVPTITLDGAAERYGFADAAFLKLDTQGTELDILESGERLVQGSLLGVYTESLFQPFYKGQSLFADVDSFLRRHGFTLISLNRTMLRRAGYRRTMYSKRVITWAHCLYLREPETLPAIADGEVLARQVARLLALTLTFAFHDLAFEIVELAGRLGVVSPEEVSALDGEVTRVAAELTDHLCQEKGSSDTVLSASFRDPRRYD